MRKVLLLGGYGGFGARIASRLAPTGFEVLVAGRSLDKARAFCAGKRDMRPLAVDFRAGIDTVLEAERPFAVVDAAGPFQGADYTVARAAIRAGCHYLDIADARDFVCGVGDLDAAAKAAGISVISGASSVPALSGATARRLSKGMEDVRAVEMAISASNRATAGPSVARAILSYVGRPVRLWRGGSWSTGYGWQEMRRQSFEISGQPPIRGRLTALAEVPDLELLPRRLAGSPAVIFRAGTELWLHNVALWLGSWLVRLGWVRDLRRWAPIILRGQRLTRRLGSDRSAMIVRLFGTAQHRRVERRWTLIASEGDGPEIPALAVPILLDLLARQGIPAGAMDAGALLSLSDFEPSFAQLAISHETIQIDQPDPLYRRIMEERFERLPHQVQQMHEALRTGSAAGSARVTRGRNWAARLIAAMMRFPPAGEHELEVRFEERNGTERWIRDFGGSRFSSQLSQAGPLLIERFGPFRFGFDLPSDENGLSMKLLRWWVGPLPMPLALAPYGLAREWEEDGRFRFDVPIWLPLIGLVVHYEGWLRALPLERLDRHQTARHVGVGDQP